jgi:predicted ester cyclase
MSAKDLKALGRGFINEMNKGKAAAMALIDKSCATNIVWHDANGQDIRGLKDFKKYMDEMYEAFPDIHWTIDDMIVEGDKAVIRYTVTGTHKRELMGIPATNKKITLVALEMDRIVGGKLVEGWIRLDTLGMMQQLGVVPTPQKK